MAEREIPIKDIIARVSHLEIRARKLVEDTLSSEYHSVFKGRGIEFNEVRNYLVGDDVRDIDWNVTARMREPYVKTYIEERELSVIFAVDVSGSAEFGSDKSRRELIAEMVALLGFASFFNNDRAGLVLFSEDIEKVVPARKNYSHMLRIIRDSWYYAPRRKGTGIAASLQSLSSMLKKKSIVFLVSDFLDRNYEKNLQALSSRHDVIPIVVRDPMEEAWDRYSDTGLFSRLPVLADIEDMEKGSRKTIDLDVHTYTEIGKFRDYYRKVFKKLSLDYAEITSRGDYYKTIELLLRKRNRAGSGAGGMGFTATGQAGVAKLVETLVVTDHHGSAGRLAQCGEFIRAGQLVVFPTETVYGLGANALDEKAVAGIFKAKGRHPDNPLIVHIADVNDLPKVASNIPDIARKLFAAFSPGPLTVVLPKQRSVPGNVTAGLPTVAVRIPSNPVARELIRVSGVPIAAPSANRSGKVSPTTFEMAYKEMNTRVRAIIDGGDCDVGLESTVVTVDGGRVQILRPGSITAEMIQTALFGFGGPEMGSVDPAALLGKGPARSPGMKFAHYKPEARVYLAETIDPPALSARFPGKKIGLLAVNFPADGLPRELASSFILANYASMKEYARSMYRTFSSMDREGADIIVAQAVPLKGLGSAIMNRLEKSSEGNRI